MKKWLRIGLNVLVGCLAVLGLYGVYRWSSDQKNNKESAESSIQTMTESEYLKQQSEISNSKEESQDSENSEGGQETSRPAGEYEEWSYAGFYKIGETMEGTLSGTEGTVRITVTDCRLLREDDESLDPSKFCTNIDYMMPAMKYGEIQPTLYYYPRFVQEDGTFIDGILMVLITVRIENVDAKNNEHAFNHLGSEYLFHPTVRPVSSKWRRDSVKSPWRRVVIYDEPAYFTLLGEYSEQHPFHIYLEPGESLEYTIGYYLSDRQGTGKEIPSEIRLEVCLNGSYCVNPELK
ncbi:MAG: hypothetical protein IKG91_00820 [Firmicutes bacterium]|nr:hypothetical protein [Bacillota bacterium]